MKPCKKKILSEKCPILNRKRSSLKSLDSNIASFKVSRQVCNIFVQVLLQDCSRLVMKCLASCAVSCVGPAGKPAVPGKGGW